MLKIKIMKKLFLLLTVFAFISSACSPLFYQQIATLHSENVNLKDDGTFAYEDGVMTIEYDFWAESGKFKFVVTNHSDDNIYLNLAESYFVDNGCAHDYYQSRTYVHSTKSTVSSGFMVAGTSSTFAATTGQGAFVEYAEKAIVSIPAHSYKVFEEFSVASSVFRECGFVRDPSKKERAVREFNDYTSPKVIENRLVFNMGDVAIPVTNVFYVSQYQNISTDDATDYVKVEKCDGYRESVMVHKMAANNKFYITYVVDDLISAEGSDNDRRLESRGKSSARKFNDGLYRR